MRTPASFFLTILAATFAAMPLYADATQSFATGTSNGAQDFSYTYITANGQPQTLAFRLNLDDIRRGSAEFRPWDDFAARSAAITATQQRAKQLETPDLQASVQALPNGMNIRLMGRNLTPQSPKVQLLKTELNTIYTTTIQSYASQNLYRAVPEGENRTRVGPNHSAIALRYTPAMGPIARAIMQQVPGAGTDPRAFINAALGWLQTIPYDTLKDRSTSNGAGFQTPYGLLLGNLGDCDTKAVALAALIRSAYPSIPLTMVYVPDHAFLGVGLPQTAQDYALSTGEGVYVLADATGPRLTALGIIDDETRDKLRAKQTELLPIR